MDLCRRYSFFWAGAFLLACSLLPLMKVHAQSVGAPILTESDDRFSLSFNTGYFRNDFFGVRNSSPRFLFKGIYGFGEQLDLFGEIGAAKLTLRVPQGDPPNFDDGYHLAVGGGFTFRYLRVNSLGLSLFLTGHVFRFTSNPRSEKQLLLGGSNITQITEFEYDWKEGNVSLGGIRRWGNFKVYSGLTGSVIKRSEKRIHRNVIGGSLGSADILDGEFSSGLQIRPFLGIDIMLPSRYFISAVVTAKSRDDFLITLGISQTGKP